MNINVPYAPPLRFPEFSGEWKRIKVSDLLDFYSTNSLAWEALNYESGEIKNLHYGLIHKGLPTLIDTMVDSLPFINETNTPRKYTLCKCGDVAFADASEDTNEVGKAVELFQLGNDKVVCGLHTIHGRDNSGCTASGFKGYAFNSMAFHYQMRRIAQGTKIYSIITRNFEEAYIGVPYKEEQSKVAKLLSLINKRIATQIGLIEDLKKLKSAIIHRYFDKGDAQLVGLYGCLRQVSERNRLHNSYPVLSVSNKFGFVSQSEQFEDRVIASDDTSNYKVVGRDTFAYNPARINVGSIARYTNEGKGIVSPMYICFRTNEVLPPQYFEYYFQSTAFKYEMNKRPEGSVRQCLTFENLTNIKIALPPVIEQTKIAEKLSAIEKKIAIEMRIKDCYARQREYLLQQMFI